MKKKYFLQLITMLQEIDTKKNDADTLKEVLNYIAEELKQYINYIK